MRFTMYFTTKEIDIAFFSFFCQIANPGSNLRYEYESTLSLKFSILEDN